MIWLVGSKGMLGSDLECLLKKRSKKFISSDKEVDITNLAELETFIEPHFANQSKSQDEANWIVNCAAYTAVDNAEDEENRELCFAINQKGPENLAIVSRKSNARLIHISTDYVFDGKKPEAYVEDDTTKPLSVYGESKLLGEKAILENWSKSIIVRTAWLYGKNNSNFVYTMLKLFKERDELTIISDQWGSPSYSVDLAEALLSIIDFKVNESNFPYGIYHFTNTGKTNWYEFSKEIYRQAREKNLVDKEVKIKPIPTSEYPTKAKRPQNSLLSKDKIIKQFQLSIPPWESSLERFLEEVKNG